ncbi:basement membrane-specific heparan sulfate proteoglycan core protein, partial [Trichonephila clavata]
MQKLRFGVSFISLKGITTCPPGQFQCDGSRCVDERRRCDSRPDCADRSDEADCEKPKACQPDEFRCGDGQCIKEFLKCDRRYDCQDGSDELSCAGVVCPPGTFRCDNGSCIDLFLRCDGRGDCPDRSGADERGCPCSPSQWQCDFGQCLDRSKLCDGTVDCPDDNSDERDCGIPGCTPDKFRCSDGTCIPAENKCNGRRECRDGSDERNCLPPTVTPDLVETRTAPFGSTVVMDCKTTLDPPLAYTWYKQGGVLPLEATTNGVQLTIPDVKGEDAGTYICTAKSPVGTIDVPTILIVTGRSPPTARVEPERQTIMQGSSGELRCIVGGIPRPTVSWSKVGADLSNRHRVKEDNLYISDVTVEDRGLYVCRAENRDGSAQASAIVEVERREVPAIELYPEATQTVIRGGSSLFQCRVTAGIPTPTVEWVRADGSPFTSSTEILNGGGVIKFNRVTLDEEGTYICTAENFGGRVTAQAVLQIQGAPTVKIIQANPYRVRPGETVRFECLSEGDPRPNVSWRKLRHPLVSYAASDESVDGKALLEIRRVSQSDSGVYICSARSSAGVTEERIQLIVEETDSVVPEVMVEDRVTTTATVNSSVELRCFVRGTDEDIYLKWTRTDGGQIPVNHRLQDGVLYIPNVQPEDAGEYSCLGIVEGDVILFTARARLAVVAPPRIQLNPPRQTARPGDIVRIQCSAIGDQPIAIDWSRIGGYLSPSMVQAGGILTFQGITANDTGRYLCTAANAAGKAEGVAEVFVNEETPLDYVRKEETAFVGSNIQLKCAVSGSPAPQLDWSKDGGPLLDNARVINNELWLRDVRMENAGRYICTASNSAGRTRDYVILNVRAVPTLEVKIESNKEVVNMGDTLDLRFPPTVTPDLVETRTAPFGSTVVMDCKTTLDPPLAYT